MAFFSNQGTAIYSGAAGMGGPLRAFKDGSLGKARMKRRRGGVGHPGGGPTMAYRDGSLGGAGYGLREAFQDGSLGASGSGPLQSFHDGSLGMPLFLETQEGLQLLEEPVSIHHGMPGGMGEYFAATGEYFSGTAGTGCRGCGGLGQTAGAAVFDLSDPVSLKEFKLAIVVAPWVLPFVGGAADQIEAELADPRWTPFTSQLVDAWISGYPDFVLASQGKTTGPGPESNAIFAELEKDFPLPERIPNYRGLFTVYAGANIMMTPNPAGVSLIPPGSLPVMTKFFSDATASGQDGMILPPSSVAAPKQANVMMLGLGVAALAVVGLAFMGGKKKRR